MIASGRVLWCWMTLCFSLVRGRGCGWMHTVKLSFGLFWRKLAVPHPFLPDGSHDFQVFWCFWGEHCWVVHYCRWLLCVKLASLDLLVIVWSLFRKLDLCSTSSWRWPMIWGERVGTENTQCCGEGWCCFSESKPVMVQESLIHSFLHSFTRWFLRHLYFPPNKWCFPGLLGILGDLYLCSWCVWMEVCIFTIAKSGQPNVSLKFWTLGENLEKI